MTIIKTKVLVKRITVGLENRKQDELSLLFGKNSLNMWTFSAVWSGWKHKANTAFPSENIYTISMFMLLKSCFRTCFRASENLNKIVDWLTPENNHLSHWVDIATCGLSLFYKALSKQSSTVDKKKNWNPRTYCCLTVQEKKKIMQQQKQITLIFQYWLLVWNSSQ